MKNIITASALVLSATAATAGTVSPDWTATSAGVTLTSPSGDGVTASGANISTGIHTNLFADGSVYTLAIGETLTIEATVNFGGSLAGASEHSGAFRFGIFNDNATTGSTGWSGYFALADTDGSAGTTGGLYERNGSAYDYWSGTGGTRLSTYVSSETSLVADTGYSLRLSLTRTDSGVSIDALMAFASDTSRTLIMDSRTDTASPTVSFDRFGIYASYRLAPETITLSGVNLTVIPETDFAWLALALPLVAGIRMRRKR